MKSLKPRLLTAVIGIPFAFALIFFAELWNPLVGLILGAVSAFMICEYLHAAQLLKRFALSVPCALFAFALPNLITTQWIFILLFAFLVIVFSVMIFQHEQITFSNLSYAVLGTLLISFGMSSIACVCAASSSIIFYFVVALSLPWMADAGGFFVGATLGRHKLCPNISPKKTVEGAIGGIIFCIIAAFLIGLIYQYLVMPDANISFGALLLVGAIDAPLSILGDLSFSLIKRSLKIKDYGSIFPGHGGMLDRFDSIIFTAPVIVVIHQFLPFITLG